MSEAQQTQTMTTTRTVAPAAKATLKVEDHLPLVWKVARQIARRLPRSVSVDELVGAGTIGLMDALSRYQEQRCDRFAAYAEIRIRGAIIDQLREMDTAPRSTRRARRALDDADRTLRFKLGRAPDINELANALGTDAAGIEKMRRNIHSAELVRDLDMDEQQGNQRGADAVCVDHELRERLTVAIAALPERNQQILSLYYVDELKLREIGELLDVTESRVCQLVRETAGKLRGSLGDD